MHFSGGFGGHGGGLMGHGHGGHAGHHGHHGGGHHAGGEPDQSLSWNMAMQAESKPALFKLFKKEFRFTQNMGWLLLFVGLTLWLAVIYKLRHSEPQEKAQVDALQQPLSQQAALMSHAQQAVYAPQPQSVPQPAAPTLGDFSMNTPGSAYAQPANPAQWAQMASEMTGRATQSAITSRFSGLEQYGGSPGLYAGAYPYAQSALPTAQRSAGNQRMRTFAAR